MTERELQAMIWLQGRWLTRDNALRLLERFGSAENVRQAEERALLEVCPLSPAEKERMNDRSLGEAVRTLQRCKNEGVDILPLSDPRYPAPLREIFDPPLVLYVRGRLPDFDLTTAVAIVGQRKATPYGMTVAEKMGYHLSENGVCVVSGMAAGIDSAGHTGAIQGRTPTVAVFGTAIDKCYPAENAPLLRRILFSGAAVSEYPPGFSSGRGYSFVRRNRIISGLCRGVVVAEAPKKSGSLITAALALEQGREVFAVPGSVDAQSSEGCNELIASGAQLVRSAEDVLAALGYQKEKLRLPEKPSAHEERPAARPAPVEQDPVLRALDGMCTLDELSRKTGLSVGELMGKLTVLELQGKVRQHPGQYYEKI